MLRHPVVESLWSEVEQTVTALGYELVQMTLGGPGGAQSLTVYVDQPGGVTADDCAWVAEHLSVLLDALDPLPGSYELVVSSPGVDRPLGRDEDFPGAVGRTLQVRWLAASGRTRRVRGRLEAVEGHELVLTTEGSRLRLPLAQVSGAQVIFDWEDYDWDRVRGSRS